MHNLTSRARTGTGAAGRGGCTRIRALTHDRPVYFRAHSSLVIAAEEKARREGMSLSELLRAALRDKIRETA